MSEFDAFESAAQETQDVDAAADFLAKEQDQLATIEGEDFGFTGADDSAQPPAGMLFIIYLSFSCLNNISICM